MQDKPVDHGGTGDDDDDDDQCCRSIVFGSRSLRMSHGLLADVMKATVAISGGADSEDEDTVVAAFLRRQLKKRCGVDGR